MPNLTTLFILCSFFQVCLYSLNRCISKISRQQSQSLPCYPEKHGSFNPNTSRNYQLTKNWSSVCVCFCVYIYLKFITVVDQPVVIYSKFSHSKNVRGASRINMILFFIILWYMGFVTKDGMLLFRDLTSWLCPFPGGHRRTLYYMCPPDFYEEFWL